MINIVFLGLNKELSFLPCNKVWRTLQIVSTLTEKNSLHLFLRWFPQIIRAIIIITTFGCQIRTLGRKKSDFALFKINRFCRQFRKVDVRSNRKTQNRKKLPSEALSKRGNILNKGKKILLRFQLLNWRRKRKLNLVIHISVKMDVSRWLKTQ